MLPYDVVGGPSPLRLLLVALACILAFGSGAARSAAPGPVSYQVTPELEDGRLDALAVEMRLRGDADGQTYIRLPDSWSGVSDLHRAVHDLKAEGGRLQRVSDAEVKLIHAPNAPVSLSYRIRQDFRGELTAGQGPPFRAVVRPDRFTALGWAVFGEVSGPIGRPVEFRWGQAPEGWTVASDLDHTTRLTNTGELLDSVLVGGQGMRMIERPAAGGRLRVAVHGEWKFTPQELAQLLVRITEASAGFWGDEGEDFFVAVTPLKAPGGGSAQYGVGLGDAFSLWTTDDADAASLRHIVAHEHQHVWFPTRVGGVRTGPDEPLDYWLSEGFTDFYTLRLLLRSGLWSLEEFVEDYNRILRAYGSSPVKTAPNRIVAAGFWEDPAVADLPYQRGLVLAALWDDRLRRETKGARDLDDVILAMKARAAGQTEAGRAVENLRLSYDQFGSSLDADLRTLVEAGGAVSLPADLFGACARVATHQQPEFDRGFDTAKTNELNGVVAGVDPEGPAYAAGLRNGMRIVGRLTPAAQDNPNAVLAYQVRDESGAKVIRYQPRGRRQVTFQQIELTPGMDAAQRAACARAMSGH